MNDSHLFYQTASRRPRVARAEGIYLWDTSGKRYIDASSGPMASNIGHSNPRVLEAMKRQMDSATFAYRLHFENDAAESLATLTASLMPAGLDRIFFVSGGSECIESCLKLARQYAYVIGQEKRWKVISLFPSYHGSTLGAVAVTGMRQFVEPFRDMIRVMPKIPAATCYLDHDELTDEERGVRYAELLRTGRFLASEHWQLQPDIIAMAKGFAAGYAPLGAMAARRDIVDAVIEQGGFAHGYTYAGNPLACAAGRAVINEILERGLTENAEQCGARLKAMLSGLMDRYPFIGDVRGKGLLLAIELVADRETMEPLPAELDAHVGLVEEAYRRGLIIYSRRTRGGTIGDHFMVCPPLIVNDADLDEIMRLLTDSLDAFATASGLPVNSMRQV
jgi:adenosylmethionine-8-amino-7-oxononanoate aminotransferase